MTAFATHAELAARWRPLSSDERERATVLIQDASDEIRQRFPDIDARIEAYSDNPATGINPRLVARVCCAMVKRALTGGVEFDGVSSYQEATGPFSESVTFQNPNGDLYLTKAERKLLGVSPRQAFTIDPTP